METKDIIGKEFTCFEFSSDERLQYVEQANYVGLTGVVKNLNRRFPKYALVMITDASGTIRERHYPTDMIKQQLEAKEEEENKSINDILIELKQLTSKL
jgi:hypothetical protein